VEDTDSRDTDECPQVCKQCGMYFENEDELRDHIKLHQPPSEPSVPVATTSATLDKTATDYVSIIFRVNFFVFAFSRVQTGSAFFVSLSISPKEGDCFGLTFGFGYKFCGWMLFALDLCYFFGKGNSGWYTPCLTSPSQTKLVPQPA
jgi:hypothetical protein